MPLSKDPLGGGTNADGSRSTEYCSHCYKTGRFTAPNIREHPPASPVAAVACGPGGLTPDYRKVPGLT